VVLSQTGIDPVYPAWPVLPFEHAVDGVIFCAATLQLTAILRSRERSVGLEAREFA